MDLNKLPRWVLIAGFLGFMSLGGFMLNGAFADLDSTKLRSLQTEKDVNNLNQKVDEIASDMRDFEKKYDRNQEENQKVFREILRAVKA